MNAGGIVRSVDAVPQASARLGGALFLAIIALGIVAQVVVRDQLIVPRNTAATAQDLTAITEGRDTWNNAATSQWSG